MSEKLTNIYKDMRTYRISNHDINQKNFATLNETKPDHKIQPSMRKIPRKDKLDALETLNLS